MTTQPKVVAVTGSSGYIGAKLLEHLEGAPGVRRLVTFDLLPLPAPIRNIAAFRQDVANPIDEELSRYGVNALVHLAHSNRPASNRRTSIEMANRNQDILGSVLDSCAEAGVGHFIYVSSHMVYGAGPDNPIPIGEDTPVFHDPGFAYASGHCQAERTLQEFLEGHPDTRVTILRTCPVLGTTAPRSGLREFYFAGPFATLAHNPPLQFVHDDDLARVIRLIVTAELPGVFNVAGDGVVFLRELAMSLSIGRSSLPPPVVRLLNRMAAGASAADDHGLARWPVIMSTGKLRRATGYRFLHTGRDAVAAFANSSEAAGRRGRRGEEIYVGDSSQLQTIVVNEDR